jgi:hypothetical protein
LGGHVEPLVREDQGNPASPFSFSFSSLIKLSLKFNH